MWCERAAAPLEPATPPPSALARLSKGGKKAHGATTSKKKVKPEAASEVRV